MVMWVSRTRLRMRRSPRVGSRAYAGSGVGLLPSAVAAQVLAEDLGIAAENTAK